MSHVWTFQRVGGLDQVLLNSTDDIIHLADLDPKLWVALSCPTTGLDFDERTLALLDSDQDGRIRIPDILDAINWIQNKLLSFDTILHSSATLPLSQIDTTTEEGKKLLITARSILASLNKTDSDDLNQSDMQTAVKINADKLYNGDAVFPPSKTLSSEMQAFIQTAMCIVGAEKDISGLDGINLDIATTFVTDLRAWQQWQLDISRMDPPFGVNRTEVSKLVQRLKAKIDDYFLRVELAQYAPQAETVLNVDEKYIVPSENGLLSESALAELPLSKIEAGHSLDLVNGLNPIWRETIDRFRVLITSSLSNPEQLTKQEWENIQNSLESYSSIIGVKPVMTALNVAVSPTQSLDDLSNESISGLIIPFR